MTFETEAHGPTDPHDDYEASVKRALGDHGGRRVRRVIVVNDFARINGGAGRVAIESAVALAGAGLEVRFFAAALDPDPLLADVPGLTVTALRLGPITEMGAREKILSGVRRPEIGRAFADLLADCDPEDTVIHIHSLRDANTISILDPILARGFPWVLTSHDYMIGCPYSGFYDHETRTVCTRKPLGLACVASRCNGGSRLARMWFLARFVAQRRAGLPGRLPHMIAVSAGSAEILRPFLPPDCRVHVIEPPADGHGLSDVRIEAERNREFLYLGRFSPEKGAPLFAEAAARAGVPAVFVGKGEEEDLIRAANPAAQIFGWADAAGVRARMERARAVVFPSLWLETYGMGAHEAVAAGVPVLVSDAAITREIVLRSGAGEIFRSGDAAALAALLARTAAEDETVAGWSRAGFIQSREAPLTVSRHIAALLDVYAEALGKPITI